MKTILLADDSITIQKVVELTFSDGDYRVFCVSNGAQALRKVGEVRPDVILLDVIMPEKNGYEVCEALKADAATAAIPVLLLCGTFEPFDARRAEAAGASGHLTKPFESHALVARVEELMTSRVLRPGSSTPARVVIEEETPADLAEGPGFETPAAPSAPGMAAGFASSAAFEAPRPIAPIPVEPPPRPSAVPFAAPDAAEGGAYLGFADLAVGEGEEMVVPDRYDAGSEPEEIRPSGPMDPQKPVQPPAGGADLSDDALDRLADLVVKKMTDRVVREIAWEILPGVAESVVRQRIKELEERGR
ncbi:MAG TPA: response regulator [Candidatus Polarisedimenticolia bacterium]|nr:response regulator [Candidatus Polarisedimenticolia bacterium]